MNSFQIDSFTTTLNFLFLYLSKHERAFLRRPILVVGTNYELDFHFLLIRFDFHYGKERDIRNGITFTIPSLRLKIEHDSEKLSTVPFITWQKLNRSRNGASAQINVIAKYISDI